VLVLVATLFFQSDSPIVLHEAALLIAVIPVLRLLPKEIFGALGWWPYAATALYVLQRLGVLFVAQPLWHRLHLLVVTLLTLGALAWIILQARRRTPAAQASPIQRAARLVGLLGLIALAVSVVANLFGNVTLAELLTRGTLDSGYLGLVLFAGASVLGSIIRHLLARRSSMPQSDVVAARARPLLETLARLIRYAAAAAWVLITLNEFRILRPIKAWASRVLNYPFGVGEISLTLGSILLFAVAVYAAFWIARTMRTVLRDEVLGRMSLPRGVANSVSTLTYYALVLVGLLVALAASGFEVGQLAIVVGALGVGIGFGLQNVVNNFVSGLILMFERPIQPGDWVEITGTTGKVRDIGMRATTLTTPEGADVVVPNGTLLSENRCSSC
jgi:small-conductance mechanosensitive channel